MVKKLKKFSVFTWRKLWKPLIISLLFLLNMAMLGIVPISASPETKIYVDPHSIIDLTLTPPKTFRINVTVDDITNLFGFEYKLFWDPGLINLTSRTIYIPQGWEPPNGFLVKDELNVTAGYHWYGYTCLTGSPFTGDLTLATYNFTVLSRGSCALDIQDDKLVDNAANLIPHTTVDGYFNNIPPAKLYVDPPSIVNASLVPCENFTININISNVINLYSWEFKLYYKNDILNATSVAEGPFLNSTGPTNFTIIEFNDAFNATHGLISVNCTLLAPPPVSGNGTLATISFHVEAKGESVLDVTDTTLSDPWGGLTVEIFDGYFDNREPSSISISASPTTIVFGEDTTISGSITPTCVGVTVTIYYRLTGEVTWNTLTTVPTNATSQYSYVWTPTTVGTYEVKASWPGNATIRPAESSTVTVTIQDTNPPTIDVPSRTPPGDIQPNQAVKVSVNVTDAESGVKNVTLYYTLDNGTTWEEPLPMDKNVSTGLYEATIPGQLAWTWVKYNITAYDNAENPATRDGTELPFIYQVIPEFPAALLMPLFMVATLVAVILVKTAWSRKRRSLFVAK